VQNGLGSREDYHYAEYEPPMPAPAPDWLQEMFANDAAPAMEAESEAIPPGPAAAARPLPPPAQAPAPVEDRLFSPIQR
jgi:penicillin-binding protein 1A